MKTTDIKTIDIQTLKWFDKTYGNTYFAQEITLNYGMPDAETLYNPFQYGYSSYDYRAIEFLQKNGYFEGERVCAWTIKQKFGIIFRVNEQSAKKRDLINIGK